MQLRGRNINPQPDAPVEILPADLRPGRLELIISEQQSKQALAILCRGSAWHPRQHIRREVSRGKFLLATEGDLDRVSSGLPLENANLEIGVHDGRRASQNHSHVSRLRCSQATSYE